MPFKIVWETNKAGKRTFTETWTAGAKAYIRGSHAGRPYFESLRCSDRVDAAKQFALRQAEIIRAHEAGEKNAGRHNFGLAIKLYFGTSDPKLVDPAGRVPKIFGGLLEAFMDDFGQSDLDALAKKLRPNAGPKTLNREVYTPFIAVYNAAVADGKAPHRKWRRPRGSNDEYETNPPTDDEIAKLIDAAMDTHGRGLGKAVRNRAAILMVTLTGERSGAVTKIKTEHVTIAENADSDPEKDRGTVFFPRTKNGKQRIVQLPPILVRALREHIATNKPKQGERLFGWETRFALAQMVRRAREKAGLRYVRPHDVGRHSFGRRMTAAGLDRRQLKKAGNWRSDAAVERYEHLAEGQIADAVRDVDTSGFVTVEICNKPRNKRMYVRKKIRKTGT